MWKSDAWRKPESIPGYIFTFILLARETIGLWGDWEFLRDKLYGLWGAEAVIPLMDHVLYWIGTPWFTLAALALIFGSFAWAIRSSQKDNSQNPPPLYSPLKLSPKAVRVLTEPIIYDHPTSLMGGGNHQDRLSLTNTSKTKTIKGIEVGLQVYNLNGTQYGPKPDPIKINLDDQFGKTVKLNPGAPMSFMILEFCGNGIIYINDGGAESRHSILPIEGISDYQLKLTVTAEDVPPLVCIYEIECSKQKGVLWKGFKRLES